MSRIADRLAELGLTLPAPMAPPPGAQYPFELVRVSGNLAYVSGHAPADGSEYPFIGKLGEALTVEEGYAAARLCALSILASLQQELGDLDRVTRWVRAVGYVNCVPDFTQSFSAVNGFTDLIQEIWGDAGRHARSAPGVATLPLGVPIIVDAVVEID